MVPLPGAIAQCHCSVRWLGGRVTTNFGGVDVVALQGAMVGGVTANFGGVDVVPLHGAIVVCLWLEGDDQLWGSGRGAIGGDDQLWRSGRGAIAGCRCSVLWCWGG